ncbi:uncharacterized protein K452DRAFT_72049 [Aplosporella prunicola CBS 121167]|uniref:Secreted protein n=1 Tax=Aplosporella prunicola CBS 121167 TaxID=1176127 RepID=A0A6A6BRZ0_9PEZI|nr:uncharacterized protein K452DRAFT_72049 [Aplosporella prunicola CBS 121167]KAF2146862.1 hypothetical protein K452DRAFT_72049 [Aplosporella prunicola CBS 121167]
MGACCLGAGDRCRSVAFASCVLASALCLGSTAMVESQCEASLFIFLFHGHGHCFLSRSLIMRRMVICTSLYPLCLENQELHKTFWDSIFAEHVYGAALAGTFRQSRRSLGMLKKERHMCDSVGRTSGLQSR